MRQQTEKLGALYREHAMSVYRFALGLSRNITEAEDIVAEAFARVAPRAYAIQTATARAYLLTVARNVFLDDKHRARREAHALAEMARDPPDTGGSPDDNTKLSLALQALGALPEGERAALLLRLDHDMSYEDIAATLNISLAAAKVRVHRARLKLASVGTQGVWDDEG
jgi:RNA polymerase sigma-70 factor (ECF subfamily)